MTEENGGRSAHITGRDGERAKPYEFLVRTPGGEREVRTGETRVTNREIQFRVMTWGDWCQVPAELQDQPIRDWPAESKAAILDSCIAGELGEAMRELAEGKITADFLREEARYYAVDDLVSTIVRGSGRPSEVPNFRPAGEEGKAEGEDGPPESAAGSSSETSTSSATPTTARTTSTG